MPPVIVAVNTIIIIESKNERSLIHLPVPLIYQLLSCQYIKIYYVLCLQLFIFLQTSELVYFALHIILKISSIPLMFKLLGISFVNFGLIYSNGANTI